MRKYNNSNLKNLRKTLRKTRTGAEQKIWNLVRNRQINNLKFFRQYSICPYILDFYCPKVRVAIEMDGGQHSIEENILRDDERTHYLKLLNIKVVRFWNNDVLNNIEGVYQQILKELNP